MQNQQIVFGRNRIMTTSRTTSTMVRLLQRAARAREVISGKFFDVIKNGILYCLTTLAISGIFLGGAYLFLVQLAESGW